MFNAPSDGPRSPLLRGLVLFCATAGIIGISAAAAALYFSIPQEQAQPVQEEVTEERGPPDVAAHAPSSNAEDVPVGQNITIVFDRPMVPLTQVQGEPASSLWSSWPVRIEPAVKGEWRWISTYAAQFTASDGLMPATLYTVTVPQGLESSSGEKTETDVVWRFETERPAVLRTEPEAGTASAVGPTTPIVLHFNQEMDLESLGKHLTLMLNAPGTSSGASLRIASLKLGTKEVKGKKVKDPLAVVVSPAEPLSFDTQYALHLSSGTLGKRGDLGTKEDFTLGFTTVGRFQVVSWKHEYGSILIHVNNPIDDPEVKKHLTIDPVPEGWKDVTVDVNSWYDGRDVTFAPMLAPSTLYTFTVKKSLADRFGQHLAEPYVFTLRTPPLPPEVALAHSTGEFGIFERGKPPVYYVNAVNVSRVDVEFAKLSLDEFIAARAQRHDDWNFVPVLKGKALYKGSVLPMKKKAENQWESIALDAEAFAGASLSPGIYALLLRAPEFTTPDGQPAVLQQYFALTNTALTLKYSGDRALVWATDMQTGAPVADAAITFHALGGARPVKGKTDVDGFFDTPITIADFTLMPYDWQPEFWVTAEKSGDFAFVSSTWNSGFQSNDFSLWTDFHAAQSAPYRLMSSITTDRPVYRPGDTVSFKGTVRLKDWNGQLQLPGKQHSAQLIIQDPQGTEVFRKTLTFTEYGSFSGSFPTAATATLGYYSFAVQLLPESDVPYPNWASGFSVLAYRKPEYRVELTPAADDYFNGDTVEVDLSGSYYFGAPLDGAPVTWRAELSDYYFNKVTDGWYSFALEDAWCWRDCQGTQSILTEGTGTLDRQGRMRIRFPAGIDDKSVSQILTVEADISDPNNQSVSSRVSVPVHKSGIYVGVRSEQYMLQPGDNAIAGVITVDPQGKPVTGQSVTLSLYARTWNTVKKKGVDGLFTFENEPADTFVRDIRVTTGTDGKARGELLLDNGGEYRIVAETADDRGRVSKAGASAYAWSSVYFNWPHQNNNRIDIVADQPEYAPGDTAKLLIKTPFQGKGVKALVTVERENVLWKKVLDVTGNALPIEVPITEEHVPNVYVSVVIVKPRIGETFDDQGVDTGVPAFRVGYVGLNVNTSRKRLSVDVSTDKERYLPGEKMTATIAVTDYAGKPVQGEFSLGVVDQSVLALAGFALPDLVTDFYATHGLGVNTAQMLTYLVERFKPGSKGGGGGDGADAKRSDFKDTAYWNPTVVTDAKGKASVTFALPQNLTTWQLVAIGSTKDSRFGAAAQQAVATKNVIVRPVRPRFAVRGDKITLGALVHNFLPTAQNFTVTLAGSGFTVQGKASQQVRVAAGEQKKVNFSVVAQSVDQLTIDFTAETSGARDQIEEKIPVYVYGTPQSVATTGQTETVVKEEVLAPTEKDASDGSLHVTVSPSLATYLPGGLSYVLDYPYLCTEQALSAVLPQIAVKQLQGFDAFTIIDEKALDAKVSAALQTIYSAQRGDGGFGYWVESSESYPALTGYVLYALTVAKQAGYSVDARITSKAGEYLRNVLKDKYTTKDPLDLATRASILYALSESGLPDANLLLALEEDADKLPVFSRVELAMALHKAGKTRKAKALLTAVLDAEVKIDPRGAHLEEPHAENYRVLMQTDSRTTAEGLKAMVRIDPKNPLIPQFLRYLFAARKDGHWDTTQSTVQTILALVEYLKSTGELDADFLAGVELNGAMRLTEKFTKGNILSRRELTVPITDLQRGGKNTVSIGKDGKGTLFYDLLLSYFYTADTIPPLDRGFAITRDIRVLDPKAKRSLTEARLGETYRVTLTMSVPENRHFVAVESPLPAGLEAIDLQLQTVQQVDLPDEVQEDQNAGWWWMDDEDDGMWRFSHKEFRDDRVFLFADYLPAGVYQYTFLARATTPGTFRERPATIWEMYFPETFGQTSGQWFTVKE